MAEEINYHDLKRDYTGCIMEYKGEIVLISSVEPGDVVTVYDLSNLELHRVPFVFADFKPVNKRLGYVNFGVVAAYFQRHAGRVLKISMHPNNTGVVWGDFKYLEGEKAAIQRTKDTLVDKAIYQTLESGFPSFDECVFKIKERISRLVAFDRQFALSYKQGVYYKGRLVGEWSDKNPTKEGIVFHPNFKYLKDVLMFESSYSV